MTDVLQHVASRRHADAPASRRVTLDAAQRLELIDEAEHWLSSLRRPTGQARVVLDMGADGRITVSGGAGK